MKKRGFTLIELLAVIVVLAIIALIATPIVMNVIKDAQKGAAERSAERYADAVETALAADRLENDMIKDGIYTVDATGNLVLDDKTLTVAVSGDRPASGSKVAIKNGQVVSTGTKMTIGDYKVTINDSGKATAEEKKPLCIAISPTEQQVWDHNSKAIKSMAAGTKATKDAPYAAGAVYSCDLGDGARTFYVLKTEGDNVKLIMNENIGDQVTWCDQNGDNPGNNRCGADGAKAYLASQTSGWVKLDEVEGTVVLPDSQDIEDVTGGKVGPDWMRTNLYEKNYWTSTRDPHYIDMALYVTSDAKVHNCNVSKALRGVRPVIVIQKKELGL